MNWPFLDTLHTLSHPAAVWRRGLGEDYAVFRAAFLETRNETARYLPCPRGCGCAHEVIRHGPGDIVAICRCERWNCDDLQVASEEIVCWELNWSRLGRALCRALGLEHNPAAFGLGNTRQIGSWSAVAVPVILTLAPEARAFRQTLVELVARLESSFILLAPTSRHLTAPGLELLNRAQAGFFPLQSIVPLLPNGTLRAVKSPGELFTRFTPQPKTEDQSVLQRAFALAKALDAQFALRPPTPMEVFAGYCLETLNISELARRHRCSRGTILNRLALIRRRTGMDPESLRKISPQLQHAENALQDARAARIDPDALIESESDPIK